MRRRIHGSAPGKPQWLMSVWSHKRTLSERPKTHPLSSSHFTSSSQGQPQIGLARAGISASLVNELVYYEYHFSSRAPIGQVVIALRLIGITSKNRCDHGILFKMAAFY